MEKEVKDDESVLVEVLHDDCIQGTHLVQTNAGNYWVRVIEFDHVQKYLNCVNIVDLIKVEDITREVPMSIMRTSGKAIYSLLLGVVDTLATTGDKQFVYSSGSYIVLRMGYSEAIVLAFPSLPFLDETSADATKWLSEVLGVKSATLIKADSEGMFGLFSLEHN